MNTPHLVSDRFTTDHGFHITVQVPQTRAAQIIEAIQQQHPLNYGDYDSVAFQSQPGQQRFRSLGTGRNAATQQAVQVPCVELSFFLDAHPQKVTHVIEAIYAAHPYEEPVIFIVPCLRSLHVKGMDEDNPNRFWNSQTEDWVPAEHR